jgi:hypothetical protein
MSWNKDDEMKLINLIRDKKKYDEISILMNKDVNSIVSRLRKIIYENKKSGKSFDMISSITGMPIEDVMYSYYEYKKLLHKDENKNENINKDLNIKSNEISEFDRKVEILERENKFIKLIIENKILHKKINELIQNGKINKNILEVLKNMRKE